MFDQLVVEAPLEEGADDPCDGFEEFVGSDESFESDGFDGMVPDPEPWSQCRPSGWLGLELDQCTAEPGSLSDAELIEAIAGFDHVASWAVARQARLLAEFATRRPGVDDLSGPLPHRSEAPRACSEFAADEVGLALRTSRTIAADRLYTAITVTGELPATLASWERGDIDTWKARGIVEAARTLPDAGRRASLEARVLSRAPEQTLSQLRASLRRAVLALDPHGAADRHRQAYRDRRVVLGDDAEGMASLWALLSAPDATAAYQRLGQLARAQGATDPRRIDARRADLLVDLLTGRRCAATATPTGTPTGDEPHDAEPAPAEPAPAPAAGVAGTGGHRCSVGPAGAKPLVHVIVPITMLLGLDDSPAELVGHGPIPAGLARELAADGTWRRLLTDPRSGALLDYGRTTYTPPAGLLEPGPDPPGTPQPPELAADPGAPPY